MWRALAIASIALVAGCAPLPQRTSLADRTAVERAPRSAPPRAVLHEVRVALERLEQAEVVSIAGAATGVVQMRRVGDLVLASTGGASAKHTLSPASQRYGLSIAGRTYRGDLSIEPHPAGGLRVLNVVDLEAYVAGVVAAELVLWSAHPAELEAQAIAARTYALYALGARRFLWDDARDQAYLGVPQIGGGGGAREVRARLDLALAASRDRVIQQDGRLADARYHASCGGHTTDHDLVFAGAGGARGARCAPCARRAEIELREDRPDPQRPLTWSTTISPAALADIAAGLGIGSRVRRIRPIAFDPSGRWLELELEGPLGRRRIPYEELRRAVGPERLKSARIVRTWPRAGAALEGGLFVQGQGRGHGVGLCQEGAHDYAAAGWSAERILAHYFRGTHVAHRPRS